MDVGCAARRQPHRLVAPAHRHPHRRRWAARTRYPGRPGHDRHPAPPADPRPCPAGPSRGRVDPAPATRLRAARRGPRPYPRPSRHVLTVGRPGPEPPGTTPHPRRQSGGHAAQHPETRLHKITQPPEMIIQPLLADSGHTVGVLAPRPCRQIRIGGGVMAIWAGMRMRACHASRSGQCAATAAVARRAGTNDAKRAQRQSDDVRHADATQTPNGLALSHLHRFYLRRRSAGHPG